MNEGRPRSVRQLSLALPHQPATSRADFIVGRSNRVAIDLLDRWPAWPERGVFVFGPPGSGKSHLVEIWREVASARVLPATGIDRDTASGLAAGRAIAIEDIDRGDRHAPAVFHLFNLVSERRVPLLVTSRTGPAETDVGLADLASRLRALHPVEITAPDDELLRRVLVKLFADRQLVVDSSVVDYIVTRMERSLEAATSMVARLDRMALAEQRAITRPLAAAALAEIEGLQAPDSDSESG